MRHWVHRFSTVFQILVLRRHDSLTGVQQVSKNRVGAEALLEKVFHLLHSLFGQLLEGVPTQHRQALLDDSLLDLCLLSS